MELILYLKNDRKFVFSGLREHRIEYGKYLKFTYVGEKDTWSFRNEKEVHEGCFMLDAIAGYYIHR